MAVDVADVDPAPGDELLLVSASALRILPSLAGAPSRTITLDPPLPLPPRTRDLSLLGATAHWSGSDEPEMLLPTAEGARLVGLRSGRVTALSLPVQADYATLDRTTTARGNFFYAELAWPSFALGSDDRGRQAPTSSPSPVTARRSSGAAQTGLPARPSRTMTLRPFTLEEELRPRATQVQLLARDLDGDGLTDLVLHRSFGTLLRSEDRTEIFGNDGGGAQLDERSCRADRAPIRCRRARRGGSRRRRTLEIVQARIAWVSSSCCDS